MKNVVTIVQARMSSSRLPGKIMLPLMNKPLLTRMIERLMQAKFIGKIVIATTTDPEDNIVENLCHQNNWNCYRGDKFDLLDRHYQAAITYDAEIVLKIPSDCPLIDHRIIDEVIMYFLDGNYDYVSNLHPASYPDGNDVEVMTMETLQNAWMLATKDFEREHTTPFIWENPGKYIIGNYFWPAGKNLSMTHRFTIDYEEDYQFIKRVFEELYPSNPFFSMEDILRLLDDKPEIYRINSRFAGVNWYRHHLDELQTIDITQTKMTEHS